MLNHQSIECEYLEVNVAIKHNIFPYCCENRQENTENV